MKLRYKIMLGFVGLLALAVIALALVVSHEGECVAPPVIADGAERMQAVIHRCYGPPRVLELVEIQKPAPADDEVLVRIRAAAVNPLDWHYMRGSPYLMRLASGIGAPSDVRVGVDFAGTVEAVGGNVTRFERGDEVFGGRSGAFAEYVTVRENRAIAEKPDDVSFDQAATIAIAATTALQALRDAGRLEPGQKVLINGASGGVGTHAVQIAKALGAEVTGVCSTRNVDMVRALGADRVIDYTSANYTEEDAKYDLIIDNVGNHSLSANRRVLATDGILVLVGGPKGDWIAPFIGPLKTVLYSPFVSQEFVSLLAELRQEDLEYLAKLMQDGALTPVVGSRYPLEDVADAMTVSESGRARGKIVIDIE